MPPSAIESSVFSTSSVSPRRRRNSRTGAGGNLGAPPNPPHCGSNCARSPRTAPDSKPVVSGSVDVDRDEVLVHQPRRRDVLERLVLHDVAPVTGGVADREQNRLVLFTRARERFVAPRVPVHRILCVLQEVRARFCGQPVHAHTLPRERPSKRPSELKGLTVLGLTTVVALVVGIIVIVLVVKLAFF